MIKLWLSMVVLLLILTLISFTPNTAIAQDGRQPITVENVSELVELLSVPKCNGAFSPDGKYLTFGGDPIELYDTTDGVLATSFEVGVNYLFSNPVSFSPDGNLLAAPYVEAVSSLNDLNAHIFVFDVNTGEQVWATSLEQAYLQDTTFSPDGSQLVYAVSDPSSYASASIHMLNLETQEEQIVETVEAAILGPIFFSPDGAQLAYSTITVGDFGPNYNDATLHILEIASGEESASFEGAGLINDVSHDWTKVSLIYSAGIPGLAGSGTSPNHTINLDSGEEVSTLTDFSDAVFNSDATLAAGTRFDATGVILRDVETGSDIHTLPVEGDFAFSPFFSADGTLLAACVFQGDERSTVVWGVPLGESDETSQTTDGDEAAVPALDIELTETHQSETGISFMYPADWVASEIPTGSVVGTSELALMVIGYPSEASLIVFDPATMVLPSDQLSLPDLATQVAQRLLEDETDASLGEPTEITLGDYPAVTVAIMTANYEGVVIVLDVNGTIIAAFGSAAHTEMPQFEPLMMQILSTLSYIAP